MTASTEADQAVLKTLAHFGLASFSTKQFIDRYKFLYPSKWEEFEAAHGEGGKGSGRYYSANSLMSQTLQRMHLAGDLKKLNYRPSPPGWGSPVIRYWTTDQKGLGGTLYPDESVEELEEGAASKIIVNRYERNAKARQKCIEHYGLSCQVCSLDFEKIYGPRGAGFIHVHHLKPIHIPKQKYVVDPIKDLRPVCPNCHAMIHYRSPEASIDELRALIAKHKG